MADLGRSLVEGDAMNTTKEKLSTEVNKSVSSGVSFGFSRTVSKLNNQSLKRDALEKDYVTEVEGRQIVSTKPTEKPKELIIPLIHKNRWYKEDAANKAEPKQNSEKPKEDDAVVSQAVKELIEESRKQQDQWKSGPNVDSNLSIPLLMQNRMPEGYEDGDKLNVELLPPCPTENDYDSVPIEAFGLAMLKGMGWKEGEGVGKTFKEVIKPVELQYRPKGLGLGADKSAIKTQDESRPKRPPKPGEERADEEPQGLVVGSSVLIEKGPHKDLYGKVEGIDPDNARVMTKLAIGGKKVTVSQHCLRLVSRKEYDKYSKDLSRLSKAHKEKEKEKEKQQAKSQDEMSAHQQSESRDSQRSTHKHHEKSRKRKHEDDHKRDEVHSGKETKQMSSNSKSSSREHCWLQRDLRVRFIDKRFKKGDYYNSKMIIEDVLTPDTCVCRTDEGLLLDDIHQSMLETIVPKLHSDLIMVVLGKNRGQVGRILQRNKDKCYALVQLHKFEDQVFKLDYDAICHYIGGTA
ncbi:G-patch domain and KOW motifs-containing protein [Polypterus senegalus]|uniref:G-patch domain and KOW motifs-containing protein n=1 Tax=Polypterus senegalus TaxID=55291 RepID=UPI001966566B|nr:G-patch domain and KOW motifs-containing protein [Polypterus senegalus]